jgi:competence protein ComEA
METRAFRRGGVLLLVLSLIRVGLEGLGPEAVPPPEDESELDALLTASREDAEDQARRSTPLAPGETLDPNRSPEEELDRLPGIGPVTARALVMHREDHGGFHRVEDLLRVPGIGPAKMEKIREYLDFSEGAPVELVGSISRDSVSQKPIDLNRATVEQLESLPGIGPALARRILETREAIGRFRSPYDLLDVPGIGPSTLDRVQALVTTGG